MSARLPESASQDHPFAEVVVNVPLTPARPGPARPAPEGGRDRTFTYSIPAHLRGAIVPGQLVWVPFGTRRVQAIVMALCDASPVESTRDILEIVDPRPFVSPIQLEVARWISHTYLAPLSDSVWLFLPPGLEQKVETILSISQEPQAETLTPRQAELLGLIREAGEFKMQHVSAPLRGQVDPLVHAGILIRRTHLTPPHVRPRRVHFVQLLLRGPAAEQALETLARQVPSAAALEYLAARPAPQPLAEMVNQGICSTPVLKALAAKGWIKLSPRAPAYGLGPESGARAASSEDESRLAHLLRERPKPVTAAELYRSDFTETDLRALRKAGWIERRDHVPEVALALPPEEALARARELRGLDKLRRITAFLEQNAADKPVWVSALYAAVDATLEDLRKLESAHILALQEQELVRDPLAGRTFAPAPVPNLTLAQQDALGPILASLGMPQPATPEHERQAVRPQSTPSVFLLHGVTGSGKTEIYLRACEAALARGKQAIVLVPEIALTPQTIARFGARFGSRIGVIHSDLSLGERYDTWRRARAGELDIIIGPRSALFSPLLRLGLIVLDEEHEPSYKQSLDQPFANFPLYHARSVALELASRVGATVILGSATPDVETYYHATRGEYRLLELPQRIETQLEGPPAESPRHADLPPVEIVDLRAELKAGNLSILSRALHAALGETLAAHEQAILFLNRRGSANFVLCRNCGHVLRCPRCRNPFTYHHAAAGDALVCHHCNQHRGVPDRCPQCGSSRIRYFGLGTERVETYVKQVFPEARLLRWDRDAVREESHEEILQAFAQHQADILIGTQMIAKGLDLPRVTLVGVISADTSLHLPDFRAGERTFQLLVQVAGRAGRSALGGRVIVQTYTPEHYAIQAAARHAYADLYRIEIGFRRELDYPPFNRLVRLLYFGSTEEQAQSESDKMHRVLTDRIRQRGLLNLDLIGPAPAFYSRLRGIWRYHLLVRGPSPHSLLSDLPLPAGWRIDVDPLNVL